MITPKDRIISILLLFHNCNVATVLNRNVNTRKNCDNMNLGSAPLVAMSYKTNPLCSLPLSGERDHPKFQNCETLMLSAQGL